jgi:hypothetical protein
VITVHTPLVVLLGGVVFGGAEVTLVEAWGETASVAGPGVSSPGGWAVVPVGAGGGGNATAAGPDGDVVVARPVDRPAGRGLDGVDPPVETVGRLVDGEAVVEGSAGAVAAGGAAIVTEVGGACGRGAVARGAGFDASAPALTVVETWRLRS